MNDHPLEILFADAVRKARRLVGGAGPTERSVPLIVDSLRELAKTPGLKEGIPLRPLHRGTAAGNVLASEGRDGITLFLARLSPEAPTPIHDHGAWGIAYVFDGRDRYLRWSIPGEVEGPTRVPLQLRYERVLETGDYEWYAPPDDIHSQQGKGGYAWELIVLGRNIALFPRRYFDPGTGRVTIIHPE